MNAISTPIAAPVAEPPGKRTIAPGKGNAFGTDAIYKGYDMMVRKCATHIIRPALVTTRSRADLVRAIGSPAVSFAASAADGSILITCPDGLPEILLDLAEPLDADHDPLGQKLDLLDRKLDALMQEQPGIDHLADRLSAMEFALREGLDASAQTQQHFRTIMS